MPDEQRGAFRASHPDRANQELHRELRRDERQSQDGHRNRDALLRGQSRGVRERRRDRQDHRDSCASDALADERRERVTVDANREHREPADADAQRWDGCEPVLRERLAARYRWGAGRSAA